MFQAKVLVEILMLYLLLIYIHAAPARTFFSSATSNTLLFLIWQSSGIQHHMSASHVCMQGYNGNNGLYDRLYNSFGYLRTVGYQGHVFPVLVGEMGSKFDPSTCCDIQSMTDQAKWLNALPGTGTAHTAIPVSILNPVISSLLPASSHACELHIASSCAHACSGHARLSRC